MKQFFILAAFVVGIVVALNPNVDIEFENFKKKFGKSYESELEEAMRKDIFIENFEFCENHKAKYERGEVTYNVAINHMSDLLPDEIIKGLNVPNNATVSKVKKNNINYADLPAEVDWRQKGVVTPVKNQGHCGSCWAFSTTGVIESHYAIATGRLLSLSEQQLVDCVTSSYGCRGGYPYETMQFLEYNGGIEAENAYPYRAVQCQCTFNPNYVQVQVKGAAQVPPSEQDLQYAIANIGPMSVCIDAKHPEFINFHGDGVYNNPACTQNLDHAVLAVGYGTEAGQDYWLVKNSWTEQWGDKGYIKMARNMNNQCGIANAVSYATV